MLSASAKGSGLPLRSSGFERHYDTAVASKILAEVVRYWQAKRGERAMPDTQDVNPIEIGARQLPHLIILGIEWVEGRTEPRIRIRLVGTAVVGMLGRDSTGHYFDEIYPAERLEEMTAGMRWIARHKSPIRSTGRAEFADKGWLRLEFVALPLAGPDGEVQRVLLGLDAQPEAED